MTFSFHWLELGMTPALESIEAMTLSSHWLEQELTANWNSSWRQSNKVATTLLPVATNSNFPSVFLFPKLTQQTTLVSSHIRPEVNPSIPPRFASTQKQGIDATQQQKQPSQFCCRSTFLCFSLVAGTMSDVFFSLIRVGVDPNIETALVPISWHFLFTD